MFAFLSLSLGIMSGLHVVLEEEGEKSNVDSQGEGVGNGDPEISVEIEQHHAETPSTTAEPAISLVQVLQQEKGEEGGAYEEESVHGVVCLVDGLKENAGSVSHANILSIVHVHNIQTVLTIVKMVTQDDPGDK